MGHGAGHHIEHAEHASHAAHDSFNTRVTITIAIIAAVLAGVTILGHKAHNQMVATKVEAVMMKNDAANKWTQFQAYNGRYHQYKAFVEKESFSASAPGMEEVRAKVVQSWKDKADEYKKVEMPPVKLEAEEFARRAQEMEETSEHWHHKAERLDLGDLGLQLGVVLASLAILTKRRAFWLGGIASAVIGFSVAMTGHYGILVGPHSYSASSDTETSPEKKGH
jgi:hypothetical protein